jgi:hypothetical protein
VPRTNVPSLVGYGAVALNKGGVDFDDINANEMLKALKSWDNEKQLAPVSSTDPTWRPSDGFREKK